jgi:deoxyribonuclease V
LVDKGEVIGKVLRTRTGVKALFVSVGNRIDLASAVRVTLACCQGYRMPEATRQAHIFVNELRAGSGAKI